MLGKFAAVCFVVLATQMGAEEVWFCQGESLYAMEAPERKMTSYKPQNFKFTIYDSEKVVFGSGGWFSDMEYIITEYLGDTFWAYNDNKVIVMDEGKLNHAYVDFDTIVTVTATCDKF